MAISGGYYLIGNTIGWQNAMQSKMQMNQEQIILNQRNITWPGFWYNP